MKVKELGRSTEPSAAADLLERLRWNGTLAWENPRGSAGSRFGGRPATPGRVFLMSAITSSSRLKSWRRITLRWNESLSGWAGRKRKLWKFRHRRSKAQGNSNAALGMVNDVVQHVAISLLVWLLLGSSPSWSMQQYFVSGLVLSVDRFKQTMVVSCNTIPGYMDAMVMPFEVRDGKTLDGVEPGMAIEFRLVVGQDS